MQTVAPIIIKPLQKFYYITTVNVLIFFITFLCDTSLQFQGPPHIRGTKANSLLRLWVNQALAAPKNFELRLYVG